MHVNIIHNNNYLIYEEFKLFQFTLKHAMHYFQEKLLKLD